MPDRTVDELLVEVAELAAGLSGGAAVERRRHDLEILALFDRCRSMFGAVRWLLRGRFAHEAVMLGRPLFTDSLMLAEFADADDTRRVDLVIGWMLETLAQFEGIYKEGRARGDDVSTELRTIAERRAQLEAYAREHGATPGHWTPNDKALAEKHGRGDEYAAYRLTHHFVHASTLAASQRYSKVGDDTVAVGGPAADLDTWARDAGLFAAYSLLHACRATCRIVEWPEPRAVEDLLQAIDRLSNTSG